MIEVNIKNGMIDGGIDPTAIKVRIQ